MNIELEKAMAVGAKTKEYPTLLKEMNEWHGSEECRAYTNIIKTAVDFKNNYATIYDLMGVVVNEINNMHKGGFDENARGYLLGETVGKLTKKNKEIVEEIEKEWEKNEKIGYYTQAINIVLERRKNEN